MSFDLSKEGIQVNDVHGNLEIRITEQKKFKTNPHPVLDVVILAVMDKETLEKLPAITQELNRKIEEYGKAHFIDCCDKEYDGVSGVYYLPKLYKDKCGGCAGCPNSP